MSTSTLGSLLRLNVVDREAQFRVAGREFLIQSLFWGLKEEDIVATMTDRSGTALLVIDMQRDVVVQAHNVDGVVANINSLINKARSENIPIIWVQHSDDGMPEGSDGWRYITELERLNHEPLVAKNYGDSFEETDLESILSDHKISRLVVTGAQTDACIRSTLHGALTRGYDTTLVGDAHTTEDMRQWGSPLSPEQAIAYTNMYWGFSTSPGRTCTTVSTDEVDFAAD